jgi:putative MFS transporter
MHVCLGGLVKFSYTTIRFGRGGSVLEPTAEDKAKLLLARFDNANLVSFHIKLFLSSGGAWLWAAFGTGIIGFILPSLKREWSLISSQLGLIASCNLLGMLIGSVIAGYMADRYGRRATLELAIIMVGVTSAISALAWNYPAILVLRTFAGLGLGAILPIASTLVSEYSPAKYRGRFLTLLNGFWGLGVTLAALVGFLVIPDFGWRWALFVGILAIGFVPLTRKFIPESLRFLISKGRISDALNIASKINVGQGFDDNKVGLSLNPAQKPQGISQINADKIGIWSRAFRWRTFSIWTLWFSLNFLFQGIFIWLPSILIAKGYNMASSFLFVLIISFSQIPGSILAALTVDKVGRRLSLIGFFSLFALCSLMFGFASSSFTILFWGFLVGACNGATWSNAYPYTTELYPTKIRGTATGWATGFGRVGGILAPFLIGLLILMGWGNSRIFMLMTFVCLLSVAVILIIKEETKGKTLEEIAMNIN